MERTRTDRLNTEKVVSVMHDSYFQAIIRLTENLDYEAMSYRPTEEPVLEDVAPVVIPDARPELSDMISRLRAHSEQNENDDVAMGVEIGLNRAADMIENLLARLAGQIGDTE